jgi:hypothetical protein
VALSCQAVSLAHSAGVREHLRPLPVLSIAVQRNLQGPVRLRAPLAVEQERLYRPRTGRPSRTAARTVHLPVQAMPGPRSVAVNSYPPLNCFVAGWSVAKLGHSYPMKPEQQARRTEESRRWYSQRQPRFVRKAPLAWVYHCRGRESAAAVADPEKSALSRHLVSCWDPLRPGWGSR